MTPHADARSLDGERRIGTPSVLSAEGEGAIEGVVMPFLSGSPRLEQSGECEWTLLADVVYKDPDGDDGTPGDTWIAPAGMRTDLASVPRVAWAILSPFGLQTRPAIIHDHLSREIPADLDGSPMRCAGWRSHRQAVDRRFRTSLVEEGVPRFRASLLWMGAVMGRWLVHGHQAQVIAMVGTLLLSWASIILGALAMPSWWGAVMMLAPAAVGALWGKDRSAVWTAQYPGMVLVALGLGTALVSFMEWLVSQASGPRATIARAKVRPVSFTPVPLRTPERHNPVPREGASEHQT